MTARLDSLVAQLQPFAQALVNEASAAGLQPIVTSTYRSYAEQKALYEKFLKGESRYPASPPGTGSHERGWAFDLVLNDMRYLPDLGHLWEQWGGAWGGRWRNKDPIHFELPGASAASLALANKSSGAGIGHGIAVAADIVLGLIPGIGEIELAANLVELGFPESEVAKFLGGPVSYFFP